MSETDSSGSGKSQRLAKHLIGRILVLGVLFGIVYALRPLFHGIIYNMFFSGGILIAVGIPLLAAILLFLAPPFRTGSSSIERKGRILGYVFVVALVLSIIYSVPAEMVEQESLANRAMDDGQEVEEFPQIAEENPRIVPRTVAGKQTRGTVSYRQHQLGTSDIARMEDGTLGWGYPIQPGPFRVQVSGNQRGVYISDMTRTENRTVVSADNQDFENGEKMFLQRSADWNMKSSAYWSKYGDGIAFTHDGTAYMAYPKIGHEWKLTPIPHTVPVWDGVALVHPDGTIDHLSPEEAQQSEILDGQRLYPLTIAKQEAGALGYRNGITNQLPLVGSYEGVVELADIPNTAGNSQPFVIDTEERGMVYVMAMEPHGDSSRGLDEVWFYDADTGEKQYFRTGENQQSFGPERAMDVVRSEDSQTGWVATTEGGNFKVVEPIPTFIDGELWWHTKVVTADDTDVARSVFVNAGKKEAVALQGREDVVSFMETGDPSLGEGMSTTEPSEDDGNNVSYYIVIRDEDGNVVDRIPVREGEEATIEQSENSTATNNAAG